MCVIFAGFLTAMTPMAIRAEEIRLETEDSRETSPVIIVGEKMKKIREERAAKAAEEAKLAEEAEATKEVEEVVQTTSPVITVGEAKKKKAEEVAVAMSNEIGTAEESAQVVSETSKEDVEESKAVIATASNAVAVEAVAHVATSSNATPASSEETQSDDAMAARAALPVEQVAKPTNLVSLGVFRTTGYCSCRKCSGKWGRTTATGTVPVAQHTVAVDPRRIPYGTKLLINGVTYVAEDCGSKVKGNHIDIYYNDHRTAQIHGLRRAEVFVVR